MRPVLEEDLDRAAAYAHSLGFPVCRIAVTGATGLIGSLLIRTLERCNRLYGETFHITGFIRNPEKAAALFPDAGSLKLVCGGPDALSPDEEPMDFIVHTACPTNSAFLNSHPVEVIDQICGGTRAVLEYGRSHPVRRIVNLSSMEAFGVVNGDGRQEESQLGYLDLENVRSCYPEAKRLAELLCRSFAVEYQVPVVTARLAQTFGAGISKTENRVFAQFARSAMQGEDIVLHTDGSSIGNYCYTTDALRAILLLLRDGVPGETYTVANEASTMSIAQLAELLASRFSEGRSSVVFDIPEGNAYGYAAKTGLRLSARKLMSLGWAPEVSQEEAFARLIRYMREG